MAKAYQIEGQTRQTHGTSAARALRRAGLLPGVVYGHKQDTLSVALPEHEVEHVLRNSIHLLELKLPDRAETVLIKEVQYDHLGDKAVHVDLTRVDLTERVTIEVPLQLRGTPPGVKEGGNLQQLISDITIECLVTDIPQNIRVSVAELKLDQALTAGEIPLPQGIKLMIDEKTTVAQVKAAVEEEEAEAPAEGEAQTAEPEVIAKGKEATEDQEKSK